MVEVPFVRRLGIFSRVVEHGLPAVVRQLAQDAVLLLRVIGNVVLVEKIWNEQIFFVY